MYGKQFIVLLKRWVVAGQGICCDKIKEGPLNIKLRLDNQVLAADTLFLYGRIWKNFTGLVPAFSRLVTISMIRITPSFADS